MILRRLRRSAEGQGGAFASKGIIHSGLHDLILLGVSREYGNILYRDYAELSFT